MERSRELEKLQQEEKQLQAKQEELENKVTTGQGSTEDALRNYQQTLKAEGKIKKLKDQDQQFFDLKSLLKQERDLYFNLGVSWIRKDVDEEILQAYFEMIRLNAGRYKLQDHELKFLEQEQAARIRQTRREIVNEFDKKIGDLEKEHQVIEGKIASTQRREELNANQAEIESYKKLRAKLITDTEEAIRLAAKQRDIVRGLSQRNSNEKN